MKSKHNKAYTVVLASDWDDNRAHIECSNVSNKQEADAMVAAYKRKCIDSFELDDNFVVEDTGNGYFCCIGTEDNKQLSLGWEKVTIFNK